MSQISGIQSTSLFARHDGFSLSSEVSDESQFSSTAHRHLVRLKGAVSFVVQGKGASAALWTSSLLS